MRRALKALGLGCLLIPEADPTLFSRARNLEHAIGLNALFLKFEGSNPTGTQKDRIARFCYDEAHRLGYGTITLATCGNFGASISWACSIAASYAADSRASSGARARHNGIRPTVFIPEGYHVPRQAEMERAGATLVRVPGTYEDAVIASRSAARDNGWYDANPGSEGQWEIARVGYGRIAREIYEALGRLPETCSVAVGNGTTLAAIHDGFVQVKHEQGLSDPVPRMIACSTPRGNPIIKSWKMGSRECIDLDPKDIRETEINEPLTNWHAFDGQRALDAVYASNGFAFYASDAAMKRVTSLVRSAEGLAVMTASTAALVGLHRGREAGVLSDGTHVAVLTGRSPEKLRRPSANASMLMRMPAALAH